MALREYKAEPEAILLPSAGNCGERAGGWADGAGGRGPAQGTSRAGGEHWARTWNGREGPLCLLPPQPPSPAGPSRPCASSFLPWFQGHLSNSDSWSSRAAQARAMPVVFLAPRPLLVRVPGAQRSRWPFARYRVTEQRSVVGFPVRARPRAKHLACFLI